MFHIVFVFEDAYLFSFFFFFVLSMFVRCISVVALVFLLLSLSFFLSYGS